MPRGPFDHRGSFETKQLRPQLGVQAIHELQDDGVDPDLWKIEGLDRRRDCEKMLIGTEHRSAV